MATYLGGFIPVGTITGAKWNGKAGVYVAGGNIFPGDLVKLNGSMTVKEGRNLKQVVVVTNTATDASVCVVIGKKVSSTNSGNSPTLDTPVGSTAPIASGDVVYVVDDPSILLMAKASGTVTVANVGLTTGVNTTTAGANGRSGMAVDSTNLNAGTNTASWTLKVLDFVDSPDNDAGATTTSASGATLIVKINNHQYNPATGIAGV